jgi:aminopeptidase N
VNTRSWLAAAVLTVMLLVGCVDMPDASSPADRALAPAPTSAQTPEKQTLPPSGEQPLGEMSAAAPPSGVFGGDSIGDPHAPELGNSGYDVQHYHLTLTVDPAAAQLTGTVSISATSTLDRLGRISLDLVGYRVDAVRSAGSAVPFYRSPHKLYVELPQPASRNAAFSLEVDYHGDIEARPSRWRRPEVRLGLNITQTLEGPQAVARDQPDGARHWFPCNDHPLDKATYGIAVSVPRPLVAVSNGVLVDRREDAAWITYRWAMDAPMATYLVGLAIGPYQRVEAAPTGPVPIAHYLLPSDVDKGAQALASAPEMMRFLSDCLGPYPFATYGYVEVTSDIGLETQTMVTLGRSILQDAKLEEYMIHEHAHQWFGNSVTPASWGDIWLNEGFATYFEYLWLSRDTDSIGCALREPDTAWLESARNLVVKTAEQAPLVRPQPDKLLGINSYYKGAWVVHMLRSEIGDEAFFALLRRYLARYAGRNAISAEFQAVAKEVTGRDLEPFFRQWLGYSGHPILETSWTARPTANGAMVTVQICQRQPRLFTVPLRLAFSVANGRAVMERVVVDQARAMFTVTLPFLPTSLELDPELRLLAEIRPPAQVEAPQECPP